MNKLIINNWNHTVRKDDIVYILGDFALCGKDKIIETANSLNGRKRLILGNHDGASLGTYKQVFEYVYNHCIILDDFYILSHYPQFVVPNGLYANIFGHIHTNPEFVDVSSRSFCACVERPLVNYTPIDFELIKKLMKDCEENGK